MSSRVWVCISSNSSTKVMVLDATQPADLLDSFYACNTHVGCIASVPGRPRSDVTASFIFIGTVGSLKFVVFFFLSGVLETDFPAGEEVPQDTEASQGDGASPAAGMGCAGSDGAMTAEGITAIPQTASLGLSEQAAEHVGVSASGILPSSPTCCLHQTGASVKNKLSNPVQKVVDYRVIYRRLQLICPERPVQRKTEFLQQKRRQKRQRLTQAWATKERTRESIRASRESTLSTSSLIRWGWNLMIPLKLMQSILFHFYTLTVLSLVK